MSLPNLAGLFVILSLAFANGANDLPKSVATLVGTGVVSARRALLLGTVATLAGGALSYVFAGGLVKLFSSGGLTDANLAGVPAVPLIIAGGATGWVLLSTYAGLPVSTTHAIIGAVLAGGVIVGNATEIHWSVLLGAVGVPLLAGPFLALAISTVMSGPFYHHLRRVPEKGLTLLHLASAIATAAARALNDSPKLVGVGLLVMTPSVLSTDTPLGIGHILAAVLCAMAAGGFIASARVTRTLAVRLVALDPVTGLVANSVSALLVAAGSTVGLPLSTTHVTSAALVGAGRGQVGWTIVLRVLSAWVLTIPGAFAFTWALWFAIGGRA